MAAILDDADALFDGTPVSLIATGELWRLSPHAGAFDGARRWSDVASLMRGCAGPQNRHKCAPRCAVAQRSKAGLNMVTFASRNPVTLSGRVGRPGSGRDSRRWCGGQGAQCILAWSRTPLDARIALVKRFADVLKTKEGELAHAIGARTGKADVGSQDRSGDHGQQGRHFHRCMQQRTGTKTVPAADHRAVLRHRAHGVVAVFGPQFSWACPTAPSFPR